MTTKNDSDELFMAQYENDINDAMNEWFNARPHIERNKQAEFIFEGGFRNGYFFGVEITDYSIKVDI